MCILPLGENELENIACLKNGSSLKPFYYLWTTRYLHLKIFHPNLSSVNLYVYVYIYTRSCLCKSVSMAAKSPLAGTLQPQSHRAPAEPAARGTHKCTTVIHTQWRAGNNNARLKRRVAKPITRRS